MCVSTYLVGEFLPCEAAAAAFSAHCLILLDPRSFSQACCFAVRGGLDWTSPDDNVGPCHKCKQSGEPGGSTSRLLKLLSNSGLSRLSTAIEFEAFEAAIEVGAFGAFEAFQAAIEFRAFEAFQAAIEVGAFGAFEAFQAAIEFRAFEAFQAAIEVGAFGAFEAFQAAIEFRAFEAFNCYRIRGF
ncbi:hypothetical protein MAA_06151 [Metarhizium robertsii ARSEF 23]|uniref:Uncharacterized protein n=1 Tax=Metarhizium robertsii (strain ARSEF 23 / ATCC MYA-3075) TaxID=655844 RepID=E9F1V3_METRA|nr:uncharacterized protein MAA_06151 [Metarhizium robertsii ARSEF 23]EFY98042.1 hypothetical protein MAA_06151 [Metarhizium robertsii ARSEF 23]